MMKSTQGLNIAQQMVQINELLTTVRKKGVQMKQIAEVINVSPSVLSAFYRTVLPAYLDNKDRMKSEEAIDYAFSLVNNISKKRFVPFFPNIILALQNIEDNSQGESVSDDKRFFDNFVTTATNSQVSIHHIEGIYRTYSVSSSDFALKCEPMIISRSLTGMIKVSRLSVHSVTQEGFGMIADHQSLTIHLNEANYPAYYPLTMQINIPLCFTPKIYRGIYMAMDSASHPIARRIVLVRVSDSAKISDFQSEYAHTYQPQDVPEELMDYFDYLKEREDVLRIYNVPEPTADIRDLKMEKKIAKLFQELE